MQRGGSALRSFELFPEPPSPFMHYLHYRRQHTIYSFNHPSIHLFIYSLMPFRAPPPSFDFSIPSKVRPAIINRPRIFIPIRFMHFFFVSISLFFFFFFWSLLFFCWFFLACSHSSVFFLLLRIVLHLVFPSLLDTLPFLWNEYRYGSIFSSP